MVNVLRLLLHPCHVAPACCLLSVESGSVRVVSGGDGSHSTNDTDKKAREGHGVSIQFDKHQEIIRHKVSPFRIPTATVHCDSIGSKCQLRELTGSP